MKKTIPLIIGGLFIYGLLAAQDSFNSGGITTKAQNSSISYSLGQVFVTPFTTYGGLVSVNPGVQQENKVSSTTALESFEMASGIDVSIHPNPIEDQFNLTISGAKQESFSLFIYDLTGKIQLTHKVVGNNDEIDISDFKSGVYLGRVMVSNDLIANIKLIKQ